jgi:TRAP-type C4-dicarboxylate transport system permease small subunit
MTYLRIINGFLDTALRWLLATAFAGMIVVVFLQVFARNVLQEPMIWTLDVAQLLFSWCIFMGAALALRWDAHYFLQLIPEGWRIANSLIKIFAHVAAVVVVVVLFHNGWIFAGMGLTRFAPALGISEFWFFLPIPLSAGVMILFLLELIPDDLREILDSHRGAAP